MPLRHAVLGLLAAEPASGYELTQRFERSLAHAWHASHSQIYPELSKLQDAGMVEVVAEGPRNRKTWAVTDAGRAELRRWLMETEPNRLQRSEPLLRGFLIFLLDPEDRRQVLEQELRVAEEAAADYAQIKAGAEASGHQGRFLPVLEFGIRNNAVLREWLQEQIAAIDG
jgi:DNA-binding PadR family transcriptional regulator